MSKWMKLLGIVFAALVIVFVTFDVVSAGGPDCGKHPEHKSCQPTPAPTPEPEQPQSNGNGQNNGSQNSNNGNGSQNGNGNQNGNNGQQEVRDHKDQVDPCRANPELCGNGDHGRGRPKCNSNPHSWHGEPDPCTTVPVTNTVPLTPTTPTTPTLPIPQPHPDPIDVPDDGTEDEGDDTVDITDEEDKEVRDVKSEKCSTPTGGCDCEELLARIDELSKLVNAQNGEIDSLRDEIAALRAQLATNNSSNLSAAGAEDKSESEGLNLASLNSIGMSFILALAGFGAFELLKKVRRLGEIKSL